MTGLTFAEVKVDEGLSGIGKTFIRGSPIVCEIALDI
jgi:hypothetical protein